MGLLDGILGGAIGAGLTTVVKNYIDQHGGVQGLVSQFEQHGMGETVKSWIGTGENKPISSEQVHQVVGSDRLADLAAKAGMTPDELAAKLSEILPKAVDQMTPNGTVT